MASSCSFFCQMMLEAQNRRIDDLMERISLQQEKLDKQNVRIRTLQSQVRKRYNYAYRRFCITYQSHRCVLLSYFVLYSSLTRNFSRSNSHDREPRRSGKPTPAAQCKVASRSNATHQSVSKAKRRAESSLGTVLSRLDKI